MSEILTVSELTLSIKKQLESRFSYVAVRGEVSNCKAQSSGHFYFTLKDKDAQLSAVLFRGNASSLTRLPKEGDQVIAKGELSLYAPRGQYQLIARNLEYAGSGELLQKLHALKEKLQMMGWFDPQLKKTLPKFPRTIGVVTSPTGAVIQDIIHILTRRLGDFHLVLSPVRVQGEGAAEEIARAIEEFDRYKLADVLIVGRGGGSLEDLWPFNEEIVAKAIRACSLPIVSAVGHETDFCIADFVADVRAPTPSAAAELISVEKSALLMQLTKTRLRLSQTVYNRVRVQRRTLALLQKQPFFASPKSLLNSYMQKMDVTKNDLTEGIQNLISTRKLHLKGLSRQLELVSPLSKITQMRGQFARLQRDLTVQLSRRLERKREQLKQLASHLYAIDPRHLLNKGYAIVFREKEGSVILSSNELQMNERIRIQLGEGQLIAAVKEKV